MDADRTSEGDHLRREHGLTQVAAWVAAPAEPIAGDRPRSESAARMAKLRTRKRNAGLISADVPAAIVAEVRIAGNWVAWRSAVEEAAVRSHLEQRAREWGLSPSVLTEFLARPTGWRRRVVYWAVRLRLVGTKDEE